LRGIAVSNTKVDNAIQDFIVIPLIVIIGIYVVASVLSSLFFGSDNQFVNGFFAAVGGVGYFVMYFRKKMAKL
jgi:hypothetical protein